MLANWALYQGLPLASSLTDITSVSHRVQIMPAQKTSQEIFDAAANPT
jgi:hypothetical protein